MPTGKTLTSFQFCKIGTMSRRPNFKGMQLLLLELYKDELELEHSINLLILKKHLLTVKRKHRFWVHDIIQKRLQQGAFHHLVRELSLDKDKFHEYFRMSPELLETVLAYVGPRISRRTVIRAPIDAKQRLALLGKSNLLYHPTHIHLPNKISACREVGRIDASQNVALPPAIPPK